MAARKRGIFSRDEPDTPIWRPARSMGLARALNKAGWGSRRMIVRMIDSGRVSVDDQQVQDPSHPVTPTSEIRVDGEILHEIQLRYYAFHKPVRTTCDSEGTIHTKSVQAYFPSSEPGLHAAGRLDSRTTGLLLVSNDPSWNMRASGNRELEQEFRVQVDGELNDLEIGVLTAGVHLPNLGLFRPLAVRIIERLSGRTVLHITVAEGKIRQIRRMFSTLRHKITLLRRIRIGEVRLGDMPVGGIRSLTEKEVRSIREPRPPVSDAADDEE